MNYFGGRGRVVVVMVVWKPGQLWFRIANLQFSIAVFLEIFRLFWTVFIVCVCVTQKTAVYWHFFSSAIVHSRNWMVYSQFVCVCYCCSGFDFFEYDVEFFFLSFWRVKKHSHVIMTDCECVFECVCVSLCRSINVPLKIAKFYFLNRILK